MPLKQRIKEMAIEQVREEADMKLIEETLDLTIPDESFEDLKRFAVGGRTKQQRWQSCTECEAVRPNLQGASVWHAWAGTTCRAAQDLFFLVSVLLSPSVYP